MILLLWLSNQIVRPFSAAGTEEHPQRLMNQTADLILLRVWHNQSYCAFCSESYFDFDQWRRSMAEEWIKRPLTLNPKILQWTIPSMEKFQSLEKLILVCSPGVLSFFLQIGVSMVKNGNPRGNHGDCRLSQAGRRIWSPAMANRRKGCIELQ